MSGFFFFYIRSYDFRKTAPCRESAHHLLVGERHLLVYAFTYTGSDHDRTNIPHCFVHGDQNTKDAFRICT